MSKEKLSGEKIVNAIREAGVSHILSVLDRTTEKGILRRVAKDDIFRHVRVSKEDETIGISAGLSYLNT